MSIKAIIELQAKPGKREDVLKALEAVHDSRQGFPGFIGFSRYEVIDNPDNVIEIAEWETPEARQAWLEQSIESGVMKRLIETLGVPFKAITVRQVE
jgi:heme-degrading monooxygenase HmoA